MSILQIVEFKNFKKNPTNFLCALTIASLCDVTHFDYSVAYFRKNLLDKNKCDKPTQRLEGKQEVKEKNDASNMKQVYSLALSVTINYNLSCAVDSFKDYAVPYICTAQGSAKEREKSQMVQPASS